MSDSLQYKPDLRLLPVTVINHYGETFPGRAEVSISTPQQAFWKGAKRALRTIGTLFLCVLPFAFLEPFLFMIWGSTVFLILVLIIGPILHFKFAEETMSFLCVRAECPHCRSQQELKPYLSTKFASEFSVICPECGQTTRVVYDGERQRVS